MKIALVSTYGFDPRFPSRPEILQARALAARGNHVVAYGYHAPKGGQVLRHEWLPGGVAIHRCTTIGFFSPDALLRMLVDERPEIMHIHHMRNLLSYQAVQVARARRWPVVMTPHGLLHDGDLVVDRERPLEAPLRYDRLIMDSGTLLRRLARGAHPRRAVRNYLIHAPLRLVDGMAALSQHEHDLLISLGVPAERIVVLPNAVDMGNELPAASQADNTHAPLLLFIGQLVPRKAFDVIAKAMPTIVREFPTARFVFVSHNRQGEAELHRIVAEGRVEANLDLRGSVSETEKLELLRSADVVLAPSRYEGFGIPLIEAMAAGKAVITTDVPACNEIVTHERNGLLTPYADAEALAAAAIRLLKDRALAARLGQQGRIDVRQRYTADQLAAALESWYKVIQAQYGRS